MMYTSPGKLKSGDKIGIVSPATRPPDEKKLQRGIAYLKSKGFAVKVGSHVLDEYGYLAGRDQDRADDLNAMFRDPAIKAIICSRGGYGTPRLLHLIDYEAIRENPKIFVGYSDITALQHALLAQSNLITFSGPMVAVEMGAGIDPFTETQFWPLLTESNTTVSLNNPPEMQLQVINPGVAKGRIVGGCLSVFTPLIGTPYMPDYQDAILVIEDIDEEPYSIDRNLSHLKAAGIFNRIKAIVFGQFLDSGPKDPSKPSLTILQVIQDIVGELSIPIVVNYAYGHGKRKNTIPIGAMAQIDTTAGKFEIIEQVCV